MSHFGHNYLVDNDLKGLRDSYEDTCRLRDEYDAKIKKISQEIDKIHKDGEYGFIPRLQTLEGMRDNLIYALKGLCSNANAMKERIERMEREKL